VSGWFPCGCALGAIILGAPFPQPSAAAVPIEIGGGRIEIVFPEGDSGFPRALTREWVATAARAVTRYYGRFPVPHVFVRIRAVEGNRIGSGKTFGTRDGGLITVSVGRSASAADFHADWLMTHEMVHLAFPSVPDKHHWIEEGLATYVEPIARVQIGNLQARQAWFDLERDLPQGLPETGDRGLDFTPTWGRTYWGGALFCFLADVKIHQQAANAKGLQDALRGILGAGGTISSDWIRSARCGLAMTRPACQSCRSFTHRWEAHRIRWISISFGTNSASNVRAQPSSCTTTRLSLTSAKQLFRNDGFLLCDESDHPIINESFANQVSQTALSCARE
jgi:hypothetical protein